MDFVIVRRVIFCISKQSFATSLQILLRQSCTNKNCRNVASTYYVTKWESIKLWALICALQTIHTKSNLFHLSTPQQLYQQKAFIVVLLLGWLSVSLLPVIRSPLVPGRRTALDEFAAPTGRQQSSTYRQTWRYCLQDVAVTLQAQPKQDGISCPFPGRKISHRPYSNEQLNPRQPETQTLDGCGTYNDITQPTGKREHVKSKRNYHDMFAVQEETFDHRVEWMKEGHSTSNIQRKSDSLLLVHNKAYKATNELWNCFLQSHRSKISLVNKKPHGKCVERHTKSHDRIP